MVRPILALERLTLLEAEGQVGYRHGDDAEIERKFLSFSGTGRVSFELHLNFGLCHLACQP